MQQKRKNSITKNRSLKNNKTMIEPTDAENQAFFQQINGMNLEPLKNYEVPNLTNMIDRFVKEIKTPIEIQTSIFHSKTMQRCLQHNNASTLYCVSDRKPLCVTCMYQNNAHKKHKVVPLNRANRDLEDQKNKNLMIIEQNVNLLDKLINQSHSNLSRTQSQFPDIINALTDFYKGLQQLLIQKRNDQARHIQLVWQKMRYQYSTFIQELSDIKIFTLEQMREIKKRQGEEFVLFNRNVSDNLAKIQNIMEGDICKYHQNSFYDQLKQFRQIQIKINSQLVLSSPFKQKVKREAKTSFSYMNQVSKKILQNMTNLNAPVNALDEYKDTRSANDRSISPKQQLALKKNIAAINKDYKKRSLSPKPFRPVPAVSAHKPPMTAIKAIKS